MNVDTKVVVEAHAFMMGVLRIMNAQVILYMILEDAIIKRNGGVAMNNESKKKFDAYIKAINRDLTEISEGKLQSDELIKMQFEAIRSLIDDCENLLTVTK